MEPGEFEGRIGRYHWESEPWWPDPVRAPEGADPGLPVCDDYEAPFAFTGDLHRVVIDVDGVPFVDPDGEAEFAIQTQ